MLGKPAPHHCAGGHLTQTNRQQRAQKRRPWHEQTVSRARARSVSRSETAARRPVQPSRWLRVCAACPRPHRTLEGPGVPICGLRVQFSEQAHSYRPNSDDRQCRSCCFPNSWVSGSFYMLRTKGGGEGETPKTSRAPEVVWHGGSDVRCGTSGPRGEPVLPLSQPNKASHGPGVQPRGSS